MQTFEYDGRTVTVECDTSYVASNALIVSAIEACKRNHTSNLEQSVIADLVRVVVQIDSGGEYVSFHLYNTDGDVIQIIGKSPNDTRHRLGDIVG